MRVGHPNPLCLCLQGQQNVSLIVYGTRQLFEVLFPFFFSETRGQPGQSSPAMQGRLRDPEGDRPRRLRRGLRGQAEELRPGLRPQDPQQVGDAEESRDGLLPGGARRPRVWRPPLDHQPALRLPG